jgi:hypothetical protein
LGRRTLDCSTKKGGSEGGKNKDKDTVMVKLIIQKKKERKTPGKATTKSSVCLLKVLDLLLCYPILIWALSILGFVQKGTAPLVGLLGVEMAGGFF